MVSRTSTQWLSKNWTFVSLDEFNSHLLHKSKYKPNQITESRFYVMEGFKFLPEGFLLVVVVVRGFPPMKPAFVESNTHTHTHSLLYTQNICMLHNFNVMKSWLHIIKPPAFLRSPQSPATHWRAGQTVALWTCRLPEWPTPTSASGWSVWASEWLPFIYYQSFSFAIWLEDKMSGVTGGLIFIAEVKNVPVSSHVKYSQDIKKALKTIQVDRLHLSGSEWNLPPLVLSTPTSACTIVSDPGCTQVRNIMCDDVPPSSECEVHLRRTFVEPGTYCVNITLEDSSSLALTSTTVTINKSQDAPGWSHTDISHSQSSQTM